MPVLQNCQCIMSWKSVKLFWPVIGNMADMYRLHILVAYRHLKNCDKAYVTIENTAIRISN